MKQINFKRVRVRNFLSIGDTPVEIEFTPGVHIITGINRDDVDSRNAVGKTSLVEAIYFAIFGNLTKSELKKDFIPNRNNKKTCSVELDVDVVQSTTTSYKIIRTIRPSKLFLYKNGEDITRDSIKNTESDIHQILNASPSIFLNCVIMTLSNTTPFMAKSKVEKRKFIEGIFGLEVFSKMMLDARDEYNDTKRVYEVELTKFEDLEKNVKSLTSSRQSILDGRKQKLESIQLRKQSSEQERAKFLELINKCSSVNIDNIKSNIVKLEEGVVICDDKLDKLNVVKSQLNASISVKQSELTKLNSITGFCPVCMSALDDHNEEQINFDKSRLTQELTNLREKLTTCNTRIEELTSKRSKVREAIKNYNEKVSEYNIDAVNRNNAQLNIDRLDGWLSQIDSDIVSLSSTDTDIDESLNEVKSRIENVRVSVNGYRQQMNLLDTIKYLVSEEGVKSYIVKQILKLFNSLLKSYLQKLGADYTCSFDEYFEESIVDASNISCSYFNFSGAESKKIDCACLFTFMDMRRLQGGVSYNINIYDELFDSSLDAKGIEIVNQVLNERVQKYNECIFVISHRKESIQYATGDVIFLEKKDKITKRIDYNPFI